MSSPDQAPKRARKRSPKVKTGCKTCKVRRVKCDEGKPECFKCTSTGRKCDGYAPPSGEFQIQVWSHSQASDPQKAVSVFTGFGDSVRYLEFYHHCARPILSTTFDREFWSRIALQMAHSEPAVRHALVALGFLCQTEPGTMKHARSRFIADHDRKVVLTHYNKSIKHLVDRMTEATYSPEIGLVTCLLFVCIEFLQGNYHTGFTHMRNGLKLISERQRGPKCASTSPASDLSPSGLTESFRALTLVEEKVKPIFIRGIASALLYGVKAEEEIDIPSPTPLMLSQSTFASVFEAQEACYQLRNASILHLRTMGRKFLERRKPDVQTDAEAFKEQDNLLACHRVWYENMTLFEQQHRLSNEEQVAVSALKASHHATFIYVSLSGETLETPYDAYYEDFKEIVRHGRHVIDAMAPTTSHAANYTFDISIIPPLYFVATRCRCPTTRREAVALLARNPPREGLWDSQQHVVVSNRAIELEEEKVDPETGWPVEETRMWNVVINADMDRNGGFWATFLPARWLGVFDTYGKQKMLQEFFVL